LVEAGYAALTTIVGVAEAWPDASVAEADVTSRVVPGADLEPVHVVPDASAPHSLFRPLHGGVIPTTTDR
jgi:hypothetical protein